jgi:hypothetical protein
MWGAGEEVWSVWMMAQHHPCMHDASQPVTMLLVWVWGAWCGCVGRGWWTFIRPRGRHYTDVRCRWGGLKCVNDGLTSPMHAWCLTTYFAVLFVIICVLRTWNCCVCLHLDQLWVAARGVDISAKSVKICYFRVLDTGKGLYSLGVGHTFDGWDIG